MKKLLLIPMIFIIYITISCDINNETNTISPPDWIIGTWTDGFNDVHSIELVFTTNNFYMDGVSYYEESPSLREIFKSNSEYIIYAPEPDRTIRCQKISESKFALYYNGLKNYNYIKK